LPSGATSADALGAAEALATTDAVAEAEEVAGVGVAEASSLHAATKSKEAVRITVDARTGASLARDCVTSL
jgi:hypothetical protein